MSIKNIAIPSEYDPAFMEQLIDLISLSLEMQDYLGVTLTPGNGWSTGTVTPRLIQLNEHVFVLVGDITGGVSDAVNAVLTLPGITLLNAMETTVKGNTSAGTIQIDTSGNLLVTNQGGGSPTKIFFGHLIIVNGV